MRVYKNSLILYCTRNVPAVHKCIIIINNNIARSSGQCPKHDIIIEVVLHAPAQISSFGDKANQTLI